MKIINSFKFAFTGIFSSFKSEQNMKIHVLAAILATSMGFYFKISKAEWLAIMIVIAMVISAEIINTAIEKTVDAIVKSDPEKYSEMGLPKDLAAGAVLITAIGSLIVGFIVFLPYLLKLN